MKKTKCPVCSSTRTKRFLHAYNSHGSEVYDAKKQFEYNRCNVCEAVFLTTVKADSSYYKKYYSNDYRGEQKNSGLSAYIIRYSNYIKNSFIRKYVRKNASILDIGSGDGTFLKQLPSTFDRYGLEIDKKLTSHYKDHRITALNGDILTMHLRKKHFDCISMWHVIEHIPNPQKLFTVITKHLSANGIFIFSTPNTNSIGFKKGRENWFHLDAPRHFTLYNDKTVQLLAKKYKLDIVKVRNNWHDFPLDLFWSLRNCSTKLWYYIFYPFLKYRDTETMTYILQKR